ncbi:MAG: protein-L-isoaspartate(D-aspartate) O-methyltransferase [Bacteroidetes bacterium]|nr:MAG: protein-L-isoaspartate(D-aspartate) O-methyltransferase [Bacteroidota bacterium]
MSVSPSQLKDEPLHQGLRERLVKELSGKGIADKNVLNAMGNVKRHIFFNTAFRHRAYEDIAFPIAAGQTISQPFTVATQTQLLRIKPGDKILEIGTGSGYQTCVLIETGAKVYTIERQKELYDLTKNLLPQMGYFPKMFYGDGYIGLEAYAPFDKVIVTAGAPYIPEPLKQQLKVGGKLVIPVGEGDTQEMILVDKISETEYKESKHGMFRFVPMLTQKNK